MKKIIVASDHGGFELKEKIKKFVQGLGYSVDDVGCNSLDSVDYPDYGIKAAEKVAKEGCLGILFCGTGLGISIAANKVKGIRAALCHNEFMAEMSRQHNNANVLVMGGRVIGDELAKSIVRKYLETPFPNEERHRKRIDKIMAYEKQ
ncbi:ribose-5-phosphate isomerase [Candidatus Woesearchaeota archaeon]|nr:ribose-5-phosphate isomerase [Candidatus Woesearchaeota archaeon]